MKKLVRHDFINIKRQFMLRFKKWLLFFAFLDILTGLLMAGFQFAAIIESSPYYWLRIGAGY